MIKLQFGICYLNAFLLDLHVLIELTVHRDDKIKVWIECIPVSNASLDFDWGVNVYFQILRFWVSLNHDTRKQTFADTYAFAAVIQLFTLLATKLTRSS